MLLYNKDRGDKMKKSLWKDIRESLIIILAFLFIHTQLFAQSKVPSSSMVPTINTNDRLIINKVAAKYKEPDRGNIVVFLKEKKVLLDEYWIKRVIALPNEVIDIKEGRVYIDGEPLEENYTIGTTLAFAGGISFPYTVPEGHYFVMGDNRENSYDSRGLGAIDEDDITAIGALKIYPFNDIGILE